MGRKQDERVLLDIVLSRSNKPLCSTGLSIYKLLKGSINETERPDFLIYHNDICVGLEHFLIPVVTRGHKYPENVWKRNECNKLYQEYKSDMRLVDDGALNGVEDIINDDIFIINSFCYREFFVRFCGAFSTDKSRVDNNHVKSIETYKKTCDILGFLVHIPEISGGMYCIDGNSKAQIFTMMPFTYEMCNCINNLFVSKIELSFIVFVFSKNKVLYIHRDSWKSDLKVQNVCICDYFDIKRVNGTHVILNWN